MRLRNPRGEASGQLLTTPEQAEEAGEAGLGFVVLRTVIAEDEQDKRSMSARAADERRMIAESIVGRESGIVGWTITWTGRGWWQSLADYLTLVQKSAALGRRHGMLIVPSVKYHRPAPEESTWRTDEYTCTTRRLLDAFERGGGTSRPHALGKRLLSHPGRVRPCSEPRNHLPMAGRRPRIDPRAPRLVESFSDSNSSTPGRGRLSA